MISLRATQICQKNKATQPAMSRLLEQHMSKTKSAKLLAIAAQSKSLPNTNSHAPPYNPQKCVNHPQQSYHTRDKSRLTLYMP